MNALLSGAESLRASADLAKRIRDCADPAELRKSHETLLAARELLDDSISRVAIRRDDLRSRCCAIVIDRLEELDAEREPTVEEAGLLHVLRTVANSSESP